MNEIWKAIRELKASLEGLDVLKAGMELQIKKAEHEMRLEGRSTHCEGCGCEGKWGDCAGVAP